MPTFLITAPDGKKYRVTAPEGTTPEQALERVKAQQEQPASVPQQAAPPTQSPNLRALARSPGLALRYGVEGAAALPAMIAQPFATAGDWALNKMGAPPQYRFGDQNAAIAQALSKAGLPSPENTGERIVGDASRMLAAAMTTGGLADKASRIATGGSRAVLSRLGGNLPMQASSAVGAGLAGGTTREGGGGPIEQFAAAVLGGVGAGMAYQGGANIVNKAKAAYDAVVNPKNVAGVLEFELKRAGVDWNTLSTEARTQLVKDAADSVYQGKPLSQDALRRLADFRNVGATPLTGDITQDPALLTQQRNLAKVQANTPKLGSGTDLSQIQNANAKRVLGTLEGIESSPLDEFATGQKVQGAIQGKDAAARAAESALYSQARDSAGRAIPLDREAFVRQAYDNLIRENKGNFLPAEIHKILEDLRAGSTTLGGQKVPTNFDVNVIDQLKTTLATASRGAKDGNVRAAIGAVRSALEEVQPMAGAFGGQQAVTAEAAGSLRQAASLPAESLKAFDTARTAARQRFTWQESAPFIKDALEGMDPQTFVKRHITGAGFDDLSKLKAEVAGNPELLGAVRRQIVNYILQRGRADADVTKFSSAGFQDALRQLGDQKLGLFFAPDEVAQIRSAVNVAKYMQSQPIGSAVNNSNTASALIGRMLGDLAKKAPIIGPMIGQPSADLITGVRANFQARQAGDISSALAKALAQQPRFPPATLASALAVPRRKDQRGH